MRERRDWTLTHKWIPRIWSRAHWALPILAAVTTLSTTTRILGPVLNLSGDNAHHLLAQYKVLQAIAAGDNPLGPLGIDFGQPLLRFYQCLFWLLNVTVHILTGIDLIFVQNITTVVCFAASPFAYVYFLRKLGLDRWGAGFGALLTMISVASFGHSMEAYHLTGIVSQCIGGLFFPLFMGSFIGMLRGENPAYLCALLFAIAFLSHAIMGVYAVIAGTLFFLVTPVDLKRHWKKIMVFVLLGASLVLFWVLPFLAHTMELRAVPDPVFRNKGHWFNSVSKDELAMAVTTGRLLDDPRVVKKDQTDPRDKLMEKISGMSTKRTRPPVVTILAGLGALVALCGIRRSSNRFLITGACFSLMLFAGTDDFRWLKLLPFVNHIQSFRCTYITEFFVFGLCGLGVSTLFGKAWTLLASIDRFARHPLRILWLVALLGFVTWCGVEIVALGKTHVDIRSQKRINGAVKAISVVPDKGYPFRINPTSRGHKVINDWYGRAGYQPFATHWLAVGSNTAWNLSFGLGGAWKHEQLYALAGVRYFAGNGRTSRALAKAKDSHGLPRMVTLPSEGGGADHYLHDFGWDHFLRPTDGVALPVVCNNVQWIWLTKAWTHHYRGHIGEAGVVYPMRVDAGELNRSNLLGVAHGLLYLDHERLSDDYAALERFVKAGNTVFSPREIASLATTELTPGRPLWDMLAGSAVYDRSGIDKRRVLAPRDEKNPVFDTVFLYQHPAPDHSYQRFEYNIDLLKSSLVVLPMLYMPGWRASLDGEPIAASPTGPGLVGAVIPQGAHHLVFYWRMPKWHLATLVASLVSAGVVLLILLLPLGGFLRRSWLVLRSLVRFGGACRFFFFLFASLLGGGLLGGGLLSGGLLGG